jgi:deoxyribodipyrimidine photolyase
MLRDQRLADNWALLHAAGLAAASASPLAVAFALFPRPFLLSARRRQLGFLLRGLRRLAADAAARHLPFFLFTGTRPFLFLFLFLFLLSPSVTMTCGPPRLAKCDVAFSLAR